jgi:hypothetical protein
MRYEGLKNLSSEEFRRLTGVKPSTFRDMVCILEASTKAKRWYGGWSSKLRIEDQLLITLEYLRKSHIFLHWTSFETRIMV